MFQLCQITYAHEHKLEEIRKAVSIEEDYFSILCFVSIMLEFITRKIFLDKLAITTLAIIELGLNA